MLKSLFIIELWLNQIDRGYLPAFLHGKLNCDETSIVEARLNGHDQISFLCKFLGNLRCVVVYREAKKWGSEYIKLRNVGEYSPHFPSRWHYAMDIFKARLDEI